MEGIAGYLNYEERTGLDMPYSPTFIDGENRFYTWAYYTSKDAIQAGPTTRLYGDDNIATELGNYPLATNINYLSTFPSSRFSMAPLSSLRLPSPSTWITSAESYAQLGEEWPAHIASIDPDRLGRIVDVGEDVAEALDRISSGALMANLTNHYRGKVTALRTAISQFEATFEADPSRKLHGIDLWSSPDQVPSTHDIKGSKEVKSCANRLFKDGMATLPFNFATYAAGHAALAPFMIADNLGGLSNMEPCITGTWVWESFSETPWGAYWTFRLDVKVLVKYGTNTVYEHVFRTNTRQNRHIRTYDPPFDPDAFWGIEGQLSLSAWNGKTFVSHRNMATSTLLNPTRSAVQTKLDNLQKLFYGQVATKLAQLGDPLQVAANRLNGSKQLWESYVATGFPLSLEQNDFLRSLLYGDEALLTGTGGDADAGSLNNVRNIYLYMSTTSDLPTENILSAVESLANERASRLLDTLDGIVVKLYPASQKEGRELVLGTLTRLYLLEDQSP